MSETSPQAPVPARNNNDNDNDPARSTLDLGQFSDLIKKAKPGQKVVLNLGGQKVLGGLEAAKLLRLVIDGKMGGVEVRLAGVSQQARQAFTGLGVDILDWHTGGPPPLPILDRVGQTAIDWTEALKQVLSLVGEAAHWMFVGPFRGKGVKWDRTLAQIVKIGVNGVPIVAFLAFLIGTVLGLNGASQLRQFGAAIYIADLVGVSMTREMAPLITAIIVAGRSGSAITAELGTMVVSEEIDAMRTMALHPGRYLLLPRLLGLLTSMPCLVLVADLAGILGGYFVGVLFLDLGSANYIEETGEALLVGDIVVGLLKSVVFAGLIGLVSCYRGFYVRGGAEGVGEGTTSSVVMSIVLCIVANAMFTTAFYYIR